MELRLMRPGSMHEGGAEGLYNQATVLYHQPPAPQHMQSDNPGSTPRGLFYALVFTYRDLLHLQEEVGKCQAVRVRLMMRPR